MKLREKHIISLRAQLERLPQSPDRVGQLLYSYTHYQLNQDVQSRNRTVAALTELSTQVVADQMTDARTLRGLLLSGACLDAAIASSCHRELDEYLINQTASWVAAGTLTGWYNAAIVGRYFLLKKEQEHLESLVSAWGEMGKSSGALLPTHPLRTYNEHTLLGFEGVSGLLLLLIDIEEAVREEALREMIREGIRYLLSYQNEVDFSARRYAAFPQKAIPDNALAIEQLGWGGSDLPQAVLLYRAHALFQEEQLKGAADLVGLNTLLRKGEEHLLTQDESVFGGAAGVAQTYAALYRLSGHQAYQAGYQHWLKEMLIALKARSYEEYADNEYDLYDGLLGVYLVLTSYQHSKSLEWKRTILLM